jgi:1-acyl-sn-glycerol-3-phosphate acyltransferase
MPALNTFVTPYPRPKLTRLLGGLNRKVILPRWCRISGVHLPESQEQALLADMAKGTPMFFVPNHPEYFADWMLDKWLLDRVAPRMANWADAAVVNGMGSAMQKFWLGNNIIAAVRGEDSVKAIEHSIAWAVDGNGVLLHPEGAVNWDNEAVGPLFPGAARMAIEAANRHPSGQALLAPLAWYLRFTGDVTQQLDAELADLDKRLHVGLPSGNPAKKTVFLVQALVERVANQFGMASAHPRLVIYDPKTRLAEVQRHVHDALVKHYSVQVEFSQDEPLLGQAIRLARRLRDTKHPLAVQDAALVESLARLDASVLSAQELSQEQIIHRLRRIRQDWVRGKAFDSIAKMAPRGLAPREAVIAVAPRVVVSGTDDPAEVSLKLHAAIEDAVRQAREQAHKQFGPARTYPVR